MNPWPVAMDNSSRWLGMRFVVWQALHTEKTAHMDANFWVFGRCRRILTAVKSASSSFLESCGNGLCQRVWGGDVVLSLKLVDERHCGALGLRSKRGTGEISLDRIRMFRRDPSRPKAHSERRQGLRSVKDTWFGRFLISARGFSDVFDSWARRLILWPENFTLFPILRRYSGVCGRSLRRMECYKRETTGIPHSKNVAFVEREKQHHT